MISCPKCAKENQNHYRFCLGCGAELGGAAKAAPTPQTPPHGMPAVQPEAAPAAIEHTPAPAPVSEPAPPVAAPVPAAAPPRPAAVPRPDPTPAAPAVAPSSPPPAVAQEAAAAPGVVACPQCNHENASGNRFCAGCGFNLSAAASVPAPAEAPLASPATGPLSVQLTALRPDGVDLGSYPLPGPVATIGRDIGGIFAGDSYLSPRHATISTETGKILVKDEGSLNGIYRKLAPQVPVELVDGSIFRIGQEIIRFETLKPQPPGPEGVEHLGSPSKGYIGRVSLMIGRETTGNSFPIPETGVHLGRERGDILFPEDGYVSGLHCRITIEDGRVFLTDVGSSNGSFIRIDGETEVQPGDILLMGQQLYRIDV